MSPQLLLRALLCIALILNGSGLAVAATQMHVQHAAMLDPAPESAPAEESHTSCGDHSAQATSAAGAPLPGDHLATADCCEGASCDVTCPAGSMATLTAPGPDWRMISHVLSAPLSLADHAAPLLHNRYRPPIR